MNREELKRFIWNMPKGENHFHMVGCMKPELILKLAHRNNIQLEDENFFPTEFTGLDDFISSYVIAAGTLQTVEDYRDLAIYVGEEALAQNVIYRECMFTEVCHMGRGIPMEVMFEGFRQGRDEMHERGVDLYLVPAIDRSGTPETAVEFVRGLGDWKDVVAAVGLDGSENGNPPAKFEEAYKLAKELGYPTTAHAGEEGGCDYIRQALDVLHVDRIDHGVRSIEDPALVKRLADEKILLTTCPDSNVMLKVYPDIQSHPFRRLMDAGCLLSINSDDPAFFYSDVNQNYLSVTEAFHLTKEELHRLAANAFIGGFASEERKKAYLEKLDSYFESTPDFQ